MSQEKCVGLGPMAASSIWEKSNQMGLQKTTSTSDQSIKSYTVKKYNNNERIKCNLEEFSRKNRNDKHSCRSRRGVI